MPDPTPRQLEVFRAYLDTGSHKDAAADLGISHHSVRIHLHRVYESLDVHSAVEAAKALGWLQLPPEPTDFAGLVAYLEDAP